MYLNMAEKANQLLHKYRIKIFPIPVDTIENIIISEGINIEITKYLKNGIYLESNNSKTIYIGCALENTLKRECIVHEAAHMYHYYNTALSDSTFLDKNEKQAQAFAAYFLMPVGVFEAHVSQNKNDHELAETFGVTQELITFRKELSRTLLETGIYEYVKYDIF